MIRKHNTKQTPSRLQATQIISLLKDKFRLFSSFLKHAAKCSSGIPPQSLLLPTTEIAVTLPKTPPVGSSPWRSLKDKFNFDNKANLARSFGICPDKLLFERSIASIPFSERKDSGMVPSKLLCSI
ncbi:LOW QUALITY PROTEIN: hypothetical protein TorRG33x02_176920 [Trema orientale]|uniref:Uncharacterized protein n=1 Tax=Trema orientale TaxID=63057 RepID=A0A2P5ELQ7_TREOI|nr:LOW QUALITY PROTEIN: hypothetical protein TorRG33x02_176920 [Trema orientale]